MKVLVITNLFGFPWDPSRGVFNQQQFDALARRVDLSVLVAVPWLLAIRRPRDYWRANRDGRARWPYVTYFIHWYVPGIGQATHAVSFLLSMLLQRPFALLFGRHDAMLGSWAYPDAVAASVLGAITGTPVVMKVHGTDINDYLEVLSKRGQILSAVRRCRAVLSPSLAIRNKLIAAGVDAGRVNVVYNGVDAQRFHGGDRLAARGRLGLPAASLLLFVGNLKVSKGCVDLLEAFIAISEAQQELTLAFVGDGEARRHMAQRVAECGLEKRVMFVGKADHRFLPDWFRAADLLCLPSHGEGVPNVVLEAMACGVPIVATRVGGIPEVVPEHAGILVPARDHAALGVALQAALARSWDAARISSHGHGFSWETNVERVEMLLRRSAASQAETRAVS